MGDGPEPRDAWSHFCRTAHAVSHVADYTGLHRAALELATRGVPASRIRAVLLDVLCCGLAYSKAHDQETEDMRRKRTRADEIATSLVRSEAQISRLTAEIEKGRQVLQNHLAENLETAPKRGRDDPLVKQQLAHLRELQDFVSAAETQRDTLRVHLREAVESERSAAIDKLRKAEAAAVSKGMKIQEELAEVVGRYVALKSALRPAIIDDELGEQLSNALPTWAPFRVDQIRKNESMHIADDRAETKRHLWEIADAAYNEQSRKVPNVAAELHDIKTEVVQLRPSGGQPEYVQRDLAKLVDQQVVAAVAAARRREKIPEVETV